MNQDNDLLTIDTIKTDDLGLKLIVAKDNLKKTSFIVIIEVNPHGTCFKEHVEVGDILLSINGSNIDSYETLSALVQCKSQEIGKCNRIQLKIQKKGAFKIPGLFGACLNEPCSEFCKVWNESKWNVTTRKASIETLSKSYKVPERLATSKFYSVAPLPKLNKMSSTSNENISASNSVSNSASSQIVPKFVMHQKAIPMKKKENVQKSYKSTLKPKKSFQGHVVHPPQPLFIKRKNNQISENIQLINIPVSKSLTNLKVSKSLTDLTSVSNDNYSKTHLSSGSFSSNSSNEFNATDVYVPKSFTSTISQNNHNSDVEFKSLTIKAPANSTDLFVADLKQEISRSKYNPVPPPIMRRGQMIDRKLFTNND